MCSMILSATFEKSVVTTFAEKIKMCKKSKKVIFAFLKKYKLLASWPKGEWSLNLQSTAPVFQKHGQQSLYLHMSPVKDHHSLCVHVSTTLPWFSSGKVQKVQKSHFYISQKVQTASIMTKRRVIPKFTIHISCLSKMWITKSLLAYVPLWRITISCVCMCLQPFHGIESTCSPELEVQLIWSVVGFEKAILVETWTLDRLDQLSGLILQWCLWLTHWWFRLTLDYLPIGRLQY